jgi:NTP pyrophosphatase (non-canonical NTP hydrolase)
LELDFDVVSLRRLQVENASWARRNFGPDLPWQDPFFGVVEEVGELSHALLKQRQGIRGSHQEHEDEAQDAVDDIVVYLADLCNRRGWVLQRIVTATWKHVSERDWTKQRLDAEAERSADDEG